MGGASVCLVVAIHEYDEVLIPKLIERATGVDRRRSSGSSLVLRWNGAAGSESIMRSDEAPVRTRESVPPDSTAPWCSEKAAVSGSLDRCIAVGHCKFAVDRPTVRLDRVERDEQLACDVAL